MKFWKNVLCNDQEGYNYVGFQNVARYLGVDKEDEKGFPIGVEEGNCVYNEGLYIREKGKWITFEDEFSFDFSKYMARYRGFKGINGIDILSILMGANDFYGVSYENTDKAVKDVIERYKQMIYSIKVYDPNIKIVINLPVLGGGLGCGIIEMGTGASVKCYNYNILSFCEKILEEWDNEESFARGIYISPMLNLLDNINNFEKKYIKTNKYSDAKICVYTNWIHPSHSGYKQMGDALAPVIAHIINSL
jgi:hypothetical protein